MFLPFALEFKVNMFILQDLEVRILDCFVGSPNEKCTEFVCLVSHPAQSARNRDFCLQG